MSSWMALDPLGVFTCTTGPLILCLILSHLYEAAVAQMMQFRDQDDTRSRTHMSDNNTNAGLTLNVDPEIINYVLRSMS